MTIAHFKNIQAIITDIEGTTTDIKFVHNVLFPYARQHIADFVTKNAENPAVLRELALAADEAKCSETDLPKIIDALEHWIDTDQKITPLKTLQGMIWKEGYESGDFKGHVYEDVAPQLRKWLNAKIQLNVYSSGSVAAQKLIYGHSTAGDLTPLFTHYFDTKIGHKREKESYLNILKQLNAVAENTLFLSDVIEELDAAQACGIQTAHLVRPDNQDIPTSERHQIVSSFNDIHIEKAS